MNIFKKLFLKWKLRNYHISPKGQKIYDYVTKTLNNELREEDKIQAYEELMETIMEDQKLDKFHACIFMLECFILVEQYGYKELEE